MYIFLQPDFKAIKKRIEDLITRDYLERDKINPNMFRYLAWSGLVEYPDEVMTVATLKEGGQFTVEGQTYMMASMSAT